MFGEVSIAVSSNSTLHFLNVSNYSKELLCAIQLEIGKIWNGDLDGDDEIDTIKLEIKELFNGKSLEQKHGLVSEFICHLYLRSCGFGQHFLFRNLEERGMKKGFDGLYLINDEYWIYESKSTLPTTLSDTHNGNISTAYNDLKHKIEGKKIKNNPWKNAYTHATSRSIKENITLSQTLKSFSTDYIKKKYHSISGFNVIPSSTIYLDSRWSIIDTDDLKLKIESLIKNYTCKGLNVICLNKKSIADFINFIDGK